VPETLHLEYACTEAERKQAQSLLLQRQVGGGSKVLTTIVLLLALVGMLLGFYFRVQREVGPAYRPYAYAGFFVLCSFIWLVRRKLRASASAPVTISLDVNDDGLAIRRPAALVHTPWSAYSRLLELPDLFMLVDRPKTSLLVIPKRAFPSESWQEWFQTLATNRLSLAEPPPASAPAVPAFHAGDAIHLRLQLRYRDYLDRSLASWLARSFLIGITTLMLGTFLYAAANPPPKSVLTGTQMFFMFVIPALLVMNAFLILVITVNAWWTLSRGAVPQDVSLSEESIAFRSPEASGILPWSTYPYFKETRWSFILWNPRTSAWMMFPKREFASEDDMNRCREILERHLTQSGWFFG
jgi:hypothetical protein